MKQTKQAIGELSVFTTMDASPECIKIVTKEGIVAYINRSGLNLIEADNESTVVGANVYDFINENFRETWKSNHLSVCNGESKTWEYEIIGLKGTKRYLETYATPLKLPDGTSLQFAVTKDITDRKQLEQTTRDSESRIQAMAVATMAISTAPDLHSLLKEFTEQARQIIGAHVAMACLSSKNTFTQPVSIVSCSEKYQQSKHYQAKTDGLDFIELYGSIMPARYTKHDLIDHPVLKYTGIFNHEHPALEGLMAVPLVARDGRNLGLIQLFDKFAGDFSSIDETLLVQFAQYASIAIERQLSIDDLRESEERFRVLANSIQNLAWMADGTGSVYWYNNRWIEYTGLTIEEMKGWGWQKVHHPDHIEYVTRFMQTAWQVNNPFEIIHPLKAKNGSYKWFLSRGTPICDQQGNITQWMGTLTDIDEQKLGEQRFRALADDAPLWIWLSDRNAKADYANKAMLDFFGYDHFSQITTENWKILLHPEDLPSVLDIVQHAHEGKQPYYVECRIMNIHTGLYEWFAFKTVPRFIGGIFDGFIGTGTSIHLQKTSLTMLEDLIGERTKAVNQSNVELKRSNEELARFAHTVSHDLKAPVRKIRYFTEMLRNEMGQLGSDESIGNINKIEDLSRRMSDFIEGILKYSSLSAEQHPKEHVDLNIVLNNVKDDLEQNIIEKQADIIKKGQLPIIIGITVLLHQLFNNIINNALKFSKPTVKPIIEIYVEKLSAAEATKKGLVSDLSYSMICFKDNGIGFDQLDAKKIFEIYSRLNPKEAYEGTGLGLALCKRIVERHGGLIEAEAVPDMGALFKIILPCQDYVDSQI